MKIRANKRALFMNAPSLQLFSYQCTLSGNYIIPKYAGTNVLNKIKTTPTIAITYLAFFFFSIFIMQYLPPVSFYTLMKTHPPTNLLSKTLEVGDFFYK